MRARRYCINGKPMLLVTIGHMRLRLHGLLAYL